MAKPTFHALLVDFFHYMPEKPSSNTKYQEISVTRAHSTAELLALKSSQVFDLLFFEQHTFKKDIKQALEIMSEFSIPCLILSRGVVFFRSFNLFDFYFVNDTSYVKRPIKYEDVKALIANYQSGVSEMTYLTQLQCAQLLLKKLDSKNALDYNKAMNGILGVLNLLGNDTHGLHQNIKKELIHAAINAGIRLKRSHLNLALRNKEFEKRINRWSLKRAPIIDCFEKPILSLSKVKQHFNYHETFESANIAVAEEHLELLLDEAIGYAVKYATHGSDLYVHGALDAFKSNYQLSIRFMLSEATYGLIENHNATTMANLSDTEPPEGVLALFFIGEIARIYQFPWFIRPSYPNTTLEFSLPLAYCDN